MSNDKEFVAEMREMIDKAESPHEQVGMLRMVVMCQDYSHRADVDALEAQVVDLEAVISGLRAEVADLASRNRAKLVESSRIDPMTAMGLTAQNDTLRRENKELREKLDSAGRRVQREFDFAALQTELERERDEVRRLNGVIGVKS